MSAEEMMYAKNGARVINKFRTKIRNFLVFFKKCGILKKSPEKKMENLAPIKVGDVVLCRAAKDPHGPECPENMKIVSGIITQKLVNKVLGDTYITYRVLWSDKAEEGEVKEASVLACREFYFKMRGELGI